MKLLSGIALAFLLAFAALPAYAADPIEILNVSYDPTREFYDDFNKQFIAYWKQKTGQDVTVTQSHGGSGKQARSVIDGLKADVVTLALAYDIDVIAEKGKLLPPDWQSEFPHNSSPYTSTIVFLVHKGNPRHIKDWDDLIRSDVQVITPNPKTSGGARWNFLAAYGYALETSGKDETKANAFVKAIYSNVQVLDTGARGSTITFTERDQGDVLIAWENEALLSVKGAPGDYEIVYPSQSIVAEPPVAVVDQNVDKHGTRDVATAYLQYLYSPAGQDVIARNFYRPRSVDVQAKYASQFPEIKLFTVADLFGAWDKTQKQYFADGGVFDRIYGKPTPK